MDVMGAVSAVSVGLSVLVWLTHVWLVPVHSEAFTALTHMGDWLEFEVQLQNSLDAYIVAERKK